MRSTMRWTRRCLSINAIVEKGEQKHFEQAIGQLERFVQDKILVCRRERVRVSLKNCDTRERDVTRLSVPLPGKRLRRRSTGWLPGTRVSNAA